MQTLSFLIFSIAFFVTAMYVCFILLPIMDKEYNHNIATKIFAVIICILLIVLTCLCADKSHDTNTTPTAMDVYSGKTELQYTVQGGEKIDSVVVYKNTIKQ